MALYLVPIAVGAVGTLLVHASKSAVDSTVNNVAANMRDNVADARHQFTTALRTTAATVADVCGVFAVTANHVLVNACTQLEATTRNVTDDVLGRILLATGLTSVMMIAACGGWEIIKKVVVHEVYGTWRQDLRFLTMILVFLTAVMGIMVVLFGRFHGTPPRHTSNALCLRTPHANRARDVEVGPIWNHEHAKVKARKYMDRHQDVEWTGHWRTTVPGKMLVIQVRPKSP